MKPILGDSEQDGKLSLGEFGRAVMGGGFSGAAGGATAILRRPNSSRVSKLIASPMRSTSGDERPDRRQVVNP